jgi:hypothetical protein
MPAAPYFLFVISKVLFRQTITQQKSRLPNKKALHAIERAGLFAVR